MVGCCYLNVDGSSGIQAFPQGTHEFTVYVGDEDIWEAPVRIDMGDV